MTGHYSPGQLELYLYSRDAATTETSGDNFFTDVYIDADQTLFNAGKLYRTLRDSVVSRYPLVGTFFPEWSLPNYVSQAQLAQMLGVPDSQVAMQDMSGYTLNRTPSGSSTRTPIPRALLIFSSRRRALAPPRWCWACPSSLFFLTTASRWTSIWRSPPMMSL